MCNCDNLLVSHESRDKDNFKEVVIECLDCKKELFRSKYNYKDISKNYEYLTYNKSRIKAKVDMTCDDVSQYIIRNIILVNKESFNI